MKFIKVTTGEYLPYITELFREYADTLGFDLAFQDFEKELSQLPGKYGPPSGSLLLAMAKNRAAGCVALRKLDEEICEMKRLYVRPEFRGQKLGKRLTLSIIEEGHIIGFRYMRLDTFIWMKEAVKLYKSLGFREIQPYTFNPIEGVVFMELELSGNTQL